jgi:hypothetical protein
VQVTPEELAQARSVDEQQAQLAGYGTLAPPVPVITEGVSSSSSEQLSSTKPVVAEPAVATAAEWVRSVQGDSSTTAGTTATGTTATDTAAGTGVSSSAGTGTGEQQVHKEEQHQQHGGLLNTLTNLVFGEKGHHPENETAATAGQPPAPKA